MYLNKIAVFLYYILFFMPIIVPGVLYSILSSCSNFGPLHKILSCFSLLALVLFAVKCLLGNVFGWMLRNQRKLVKITIIIENIELYDEQSISIIFSYLIPMLSPLLGYFEPNNGLGYLEIIYLYLILFFFFFFIFSMINTVQPNPMLIVCGYHFYKIQIKNGIGGRLLISKKKLKNKEEISNVIHVFDYVYLDLK